MLAATRAQSIRIALWRNAPCVARHHAPPFGAEGVTHGDPARSWWHVFRYGAGMTELAVSNTTDCVEFKTSQVTARFFAEAGPALRRVVLWLPRSFNLFAEMFQTLLRCGVCVASTRVTQRNERLTWTLDLQTPDGTTVDPIRWQSVRTALVGLLLHTPRRGKRPLRKRALSALASDAVWAGQPLLQN